MSDYKIYQSKGKTYRIPTDKEKDFLSKRKDAVYSEELTTKAKAYDEYKHTHIGGFTTFKDGTSAFMPMSKVVPDIEIPKPDLSLNSGNKISDSFGIGAAFSQGSKPLTEQIGDFQKKEVERLANTPEHIFGRELTAFSGTPDYPTIENAETQPLNDKDIPLLARKYLEENKQDTTEKIWIPTDRKHGEGGYWMERPKKSNTPEQVQQVKDFLTKTEIGQHYLNYEKELKNKLKDHISHLESRIDDVVTKQMLKYNGNPQAEAELQKLWAEYEPKFKSKFFKYNLNKEFEGKLNEILEKYPNESGDTTFSLYGDNSPLQLAKREIENSKKLMKAIDDGDLNYLSQFGKEFGRGFPAMADEIKTFGMGSLVTSLEDKMTIDEINRKLQNNIPLSEAEKVAMQSLATTQAYNEIDGNKLTVSQEVAQGLSHSIPYMVDFATIGVPAKAVTSGLKTAVKSGIKKNAISGIRSGIKASTERLGLRLANFGVDTMDAIARSSIIATVAPSTYTDAVGRMRGQTTYNYENGLPTYSGQENQKDTFDAITGAIGSSMIENISEFSGYGMERGQAILRGMLKRNAPELAKDLSFGSTRNQFFQGVNKAMTKAGFNGTINEFLEEQVATVLHSFFETGQGQWGDLVDPRQQWITFLTVASIGSGAAVLNTTGDKIYRYGIKRSYENCLQDFNKAFTENTQEETLNSFISALDSGTVEDQQTALANLVLNDEYDDIQKTAALNLYKSALTYQAMQGAKDGEAEEAINEAVEYTQNQVNPSMNTVVSAKIAGNDNPVHVVSGNIVTKEDGSIDIENSDKEIYYFDETTGKNKVIPIDHVEELTEQLPIDQAEQAARETIGTQIIGEQENAEVRPYDAGERVRAILPNGLPIFGEITQVLESGNYIVQDELTGITTEVEPKQIINEDNLNGIDNGSQVEYIDNNGEKKQGTVDDLYSERSQGFAYIDAERVPIENILPVNNTDNSYIDNATKPTVEPEKINVPYLEQIETDEKGNYLFESSPIDITTKALAEIYTNPVDLNKVVRAQIENIEKEIKKASQPRITGDINKDIANKKKSDIQRTLLQQQSDYWNDVLQNINTTKTQPTDQLASLPETTPKENKPKQPTKYQLKLKGLSELINTSSPIGDQVMLGIVTDKYKFIWFNQGIQVGLGSELGLSRSEDERRAYLPILSNNGYTPDTLAHEFWENSNKELDTQDIKNEIIDTISSLPRTAKGYVSKKMILDELENRYSQETETYYQQQQEAEEYYKELNREIEVEKNEIRDAINNSDLVSLMNIAVENGATVEELVNLYTPTDIINYIEQLNDGRQESDTGGNTGQVQRDHSEERTKEEIGTGQEERSRSGEKETVTGQNRPTQRAVLNDITAEEQKVVDSVVSVYKEELKSLQKELEKYKSELTATRKKISKAQNEGQKNIFNEKPIDTLFNVDADLSKKNVVDNILEPINQQITFTKNKIAELQNEKDKRIEDALTAHRSQTAIEFEEEDKEIKKTSNKLDDLYYQVMQALDEDISKEIQQRKITPLIKLLVVIEDKLNNNKENYSEQFIGRYADLKEYIKSKGFIYHAFGGSSLARDYTKYMKKCILRYSRC